MATTSPVRNIHLLYNPHAGIHKTKKVLTKIQQFFENHSIKVTMWETKHPRHATEIAHSLTLEGYDALCVIGGDGTLHEVVNGLLAREDGGKIPLGIIPGGTGNALAQDLGLHSIDAALEVIAGGQVTPIDVGVIKFRNNEGSDEQRYFINLIGLGLGVRANISAEKIRWLGFSRYNAAILYHIMRNKGFLAGITLDGQVLSSLPSADAEKSSKKPLSIIMVQNTVHGGKDLVLAPAAKINDGMLDIIFAPKMRRGKTLSLFQKVVKDGSHVHAEGVVARTFQQLEITTAIPEPLNIDGENYGTTPVTITLRAHHLNVLSKPNIGNAM